MLSSLKVFVLCFLICGICDGARILAVFPVKSYSHYILGHKLLAELSTRGHQCTMISAYDTKPPNKNYENIFLEDVEAKIMEILNPNHEMGSKFDMDDAPLPIMQNIVNQMGLVTSEYAFNHTKVQKLMRMQKFDIVIVEQFFNDALKAFCFKFNAQCIALGTVGASVITNYLVGNPAPPAYIPDLFLSYTGKMTFMQRVTNVITQASTYILNHLYFMPKQNALVQKYFPGAPHIYELIKVPLVLLNSHASICQPVPHVPNMIEIGGFHVDKPKKLPADLQKYLDDAKDGAIYFSLGSNLNSKELPDEMRDNIMRALSKLKMKVLWKFEDPNLPGKPDNVKIQSWLPQQDILAHPNIKLFITHGGLLSTIESTYHGVPVIGIPIFGDQKMNMAISVSNGIGLNIFYKDLNEKSLTAALNEVTTNPKYTENARKRSKIMHDQPIQPMENAIFWIEYVLRHKGADHFKSDALDLTWYQYILLDVVLFIGAVVLIPIFLLFALLKWMCSKKCRKDLPATKSKKMK